MTGLLRSPARVLSVAAAILFVAALALAPSVSASSTRSGHLHVTKECSQYTGLADSFCTITSSNLAAITVGSKVVYLEAAGATSLDSDVLLVVGPGNVALGHVTLDFATKSGVITFSGGTGDFTHFHARLVVTADSTTPNGWIWDGKYTFSPHGDNQDGDNRNGDRQSGTLQATEDCFGFTGLAFSHCTIVASNLAAIELGSRVVNLEARGPAGLDADIALVVGIGDVALGHVQINPATGVGVLTWSVGTGEFTHFHADVVISHDLTNPHYWNWTGTYSFSPHGDNQDGND